MIRVNVGDKVEINFKNKTENVVAIYIQGDDYDNQVSNEVNISLKRCTIVKKRKKIKYEWDAKREGTFLFYDIVDSSAKWHGLFGAIIVEPIGTTWTNPETGSKLDFGVNADIHHPYKKDWREYVTLFHYEPDVYDRNGNQSIDYEAGFYESKMAINYRTEPAKTVLRAYVGDPVKWKLINIGIKETPVFHFKNYQWRLEINNLKLTLTDSIFISPQQCIEFTPVLRTGSLNKTTGDVIWYCHFYPLFMQGMWDFSCFRLFRRWDKNFARWYYFNEIGTTSR